MGISGWRGRGGGEEGVERGWEEVGRGGKGWGEVGRVMYIVKTL